MRQEEVNILVHMDGKWEYDDRVNRVRLQIYPNHVTLQYNREDTSFSSHAMWSSDRSMLVFMEAPYFIRKVEKDVLFFGKLDGSGEPEWELHMDRA